MICTLSRIAVTVAEISPSTRWTFIEVETTGGPTGTGEATLIADEAGLLEAAARLLPRLVGAEVSPEALAGWSPTRHLPEASIVSALDQALWDIAGRARDVPVSRLLGEVRRSTVPVYANINRRTIDRAPKGFARSAREAMAAGHDAFKLAPFDEATPEARARGELGPAIEAGFARIAAVREVIGPDRRLMIDCHWRFDEPAAEQVVRRASELNLHWVECPLPERGEFLSALRRLRSLANDRGIRLAGCEEMIGVEGFRPFLEAGAYDVVMPDVKYIGGLDEMLRLAEVAEKTGALVAPHNPNGPVSHAASLQISAVLPAFDRLEMQFDESPLFAALVRGEFPPVEAGRARLPDGAGLAVGLDAAQLATCTARRAVYGTGMTAAEAAT